MAGTTLRVTLSEADLRTLVKGESAEDRALIAHRLCKRIDHVSLTEAERAAAADLVRIVSRDAADMVRRALAITLKNSPNLPVDVARRLAADIDAVARPILEGSPALSDADLAELVATLGIDRQMLIAGREGLGPKASTAIAQSSPEAVVERLVRNPTAQAPEAALNVIYARFGDREPMQDALIDREGLPPAIVEKLVNQVAGEMFDRLVSRHALPPQLAIDLATRARERATVDLVGQAGVQADPRRFAQQLHLNGRLTGSFVLRALCLGHVTFAEHAFAELAGLTHEKASLLFHDAGPLGLKALMQRSGLSPKLMPAFRTAIDVMRTTELDGGPGDRERFRQTMLERILTGFQGLQPEDLGYLLEKLDEAPGHRSVERHMVRAAG